MRFLVDAQLPRRMIDWFQSANCDAVHTLDLPDKNRTSDAEVTEIADKEQRVVVTKDADFVSSHLLRGEPSKLLLISTGNITNHELEALITPQMPVLVREFSTHSFIELGRQGLVIRG